MDITNVRLNWPGGQFSANKEMKYPTENLKGKKTKITHNLLKMKS